MGPAQVTVIISTHRRPLLLDRCLAGVLAESDSGVVQVLVVVREEDAEGARVSTFWTRRDARVQTAYARRPPRGAARNEAAPLAVGEWLYFLDDDAVVLPGAFAALQNAIREHPGARAIGGLNLLPEDSEAFEVAVEASADERSPRACNPAVEKAAFFEHRLDERLDDEEGTLLLARMRLAGLLVRESAMRVLRRRRSDWRSFARRAWSSGRARARQTLVLPRSLPLERLAPAALPALAAMSAWSPAAGALLLAYGAACAAASAVFHVRRGNAAAALWGALLIPARHAACGLGFWMELAAAAGRRAAPHGLPLALADWAAGRPLDGALSPAFALYYDAAAASVRLWARASGQPVSNLNVHRGYSAEGWRPGVSDIDFTAVWRDPGPEAEPSALERWARGYSRLRRVFPILGEAVLADESSWRRYRRHGDFRAQAAGAAGGEDGPWVETRRRLDRWTEQLHAHARLSRAYLDEPAGPRRSRTAVKSFLDVVRHAGDGPPPTREEALRRLEGAGERAAAGAAKGAEARLAELCAAAAVLLDARARELMEAMPEGAAVGATSGEILHAPRAARDAEHAVARLSVAVGRPETAVFDSAAGACLVFPRLAAAGEDPGFWPALRSFKRQDSSYAGTVLALTPASLRLLAWSAYGEDPLKALAWRAAGAAAVSGDGPLLRRHVVAVVEAAGLPPPPPKALAEMLLRESAALLLLHWRGRLTGPDASSPLDRWTNGYGRTLSLRAWAEDGILSPSFPLEPLARRHARRHPEDAAWIEERILGASALCDRPGDLGFLSRQMRELSRCL